jgi:hypothetical protein
MRSGVKPSPTLVLPSTRGVFLAIIILSVLAGISLYILSTRTADFFAWTIRAPLTAAFLGAGYVAALATFGLAFRTREWQRVRILPIAILTFSLVVAFATLRDLDSFHLAAGPPIARVAAWLWLVVYAAFPIAIATTILVQERAGGSREYTVERPILPWVRLAVLVQAVITTVLGLGLTFLPVRFADFWPWPLPPLPAGAVAAWILSVGAASWWALRDGDWGRIRIAMPFYLLFYPLQLLGAIRFWDTFSKGARHTWVYVGLLIVAVVLTALATWHQERAAQSGTAPASRSA